ncbi:MAG: LytTR family DNA-binding domain-containing protein [Bacteroidota bacterium]
MKCIIIEDQPPAQRILKKYIEDIGTLELKATFPDAIQAMVFLKSEPVDLIFLDIHLPKISGMDFLKTMSQTPHIILTTAFSDYALESYEFNVVDYLLKPFSFQRFVKAVSKIPMPRPPEALPKTSASQARGPKELFIKSGYEYLKVVTEDILFIKSDTEYTEIVLSAKKHLSSEPLKHWLETLDSQQFIRVHKSYIINFAKVVKVAGNQVFLKDERVVPIGRAFKDSFSARYLK